MGGIVNFLFGRGALKKAASQGDTTQTQQPAQPGMSQSDIAAEAQKMADRARGNDGGIGSRGMNQGTQPNDSAIKARANSLPAQKTQPNDVGLKGK